MDILFFSLPHEPTTVISSCCHDLSSGGSWFCLEFLGSNVQGIEMGFLNTVAFFFLSWSYVCFISIYFDCRKSQGKQHSFLLSLHLLRGSFFSGICYGFVT